MSAFSPCMGCIPPRAACLLIGLITSLWNFVAVLQLSRLGAEDLQDAEEGSSLQQSGLGTLLHVASLWSMAASIVGLIGFYGALSSHTRALRIFALHGLIDSLVGLLVVVSLALLAFSTRISASVGRIVCTEVVRGSGASETVSWFDFSRSAEACEDRIGTVFGLILSFAIMAVAFRTHCAFVCYRYYVWVWRRDAFAHEMQELSQRGSGDVKPRRLSSSSTASGRTLRRTRSRSSTSSSEGTICASPTSASSAPRIFLLPSPGSSSNPPSPTATGGKKHIRRHTMPPTVEAEDVLVYMPVRMSLDEAARLGGREAVWR